MDSWLLHAPAPGVTLQTRESSSLPGKGPSGFLPVGGGPSRADGATDPSVIKEEVEEECGEGLVEAVFGGLLRSDVTCMVRSVDDVTCMIRSVDGGPGGC